jgi:D-alanyl-D-alanine carboxypeptidase/D-alanyl-D-alanine-endopeptidase (penicillin-binding protein 4)
MIAAMPRVYKVLGLLFALTCAFGAAAELPRPVLQALKAAGIPARSVGAVVQEVGATRPTLTHEAQDSMNPASVMKLVTTYAALELLGPAYRWKTEAYLDGNDVVLKGYGDPKLNYESFWMLLRNLRGRGLRDIRGDLVLDRSWFGAVGDGRIDDDSFRPYNVAPDALLVNFKSLRFTFLPAESAVRVFAEPALPGLEIVNSLKLAEGGCPEGRAFRSLLQAEFQSKPPRASFTGSYPLSCGEKELNVALYEPQEYVAAMVKQLWGELGGSWTGVVRQGSASPAARLVYVHESEPLAEVVRDINKFSNNVMARQLYLTLAAETGGAPARPELALVSIRQLLSAKGIKAPELVIENGSGLSRTERASAGTIAAVLAAAWRSPVMPEFVSSLPVVAADGTMKKRLLGAGVAGHAHIKTGLLQDARSIAGYVLDRQGRRHLVVMIINHPRASAEGEPALNALLEWVYEGPSRRSAATVRAGARASPPSGAPQRP